jgi:serine phosphatase RsbU (regulator of sigma subunit)
LNECTIKKRAQPSYIAISGGSILTSTTAYDLRDRIERNAMIADMPRYWLDSRPVANRASCGDFADCFSLGGDRHAIIVGDIAGRGVVAGAAADAVLVYARSAVASREPLRTALANVDAFFTRAIMSDAVPLASLFLAVADVKDEVLEYASAGHEPALHFTSRSRHEHLDPTGPLLGLDGLVRSNYTQRRVHFAADSLLAIVTDGITEARRYDDGQLQFFGSTGVARALAKARRGQADPARAISNAAVRHANGRKRDDATALVITLSERRISS